MAILPSGSFNEAYKELERQSKKRGRILPLEGDSPSRLPLSTIYEWPSVFQPRMGLEDSLASQAHVKTLKNAILDSRAQEIEAVTVWWSGKRWYLLDGHHRLKAYQAVFEEKGWNLKREIPVVALQGDLKEAREAAIKLNSRDKLNMQKNDKLTQAWRCVVLDEGSKSHIAHICGVGTSTVARMRARLAELKAIQESSSKLELKELSDMTWGEAQRDPEGTKTYDEDWKMEKAMHVKKGLDKTFGMSMVNQAEIFFMGIELHSPLLAEGLREWLLPSGDDCEEEDGVSGVTSSG